MAGNRSVAIEQLNKESLRILNVNLPTSCLLSVFGLIAFVGNTLVVIVVAKNKGLHHRCSLLVVNLAIADILVGNSPFVNLKSSIISYN